MNTIELLSDEELLKAIYESGNYEPDWYDYGGEIQADYLDALLTESEKRGLTL